MTACSIPVSICIATNIEPEKQSAFIANPRLHLFAYTFGLCAMTKCFFWKLRTEMDV